MKKLFQIFILFLLCLHSINCWISIDPKTKFFVDQDGISNFFQKKKKKKNENKQIKINQQTNKKKRKKKDFSWCKCSLQNPSIPSYNHKL